MRWGWLPVMLSLALVLVAGWVLGVWCPRGFVCPCNYKKIRAGMTLDEVEAILGGPGNQIGWRDLPKAPASINTGNKHNAYVGGDRFFRWRGGFNGRYIIVGARDGKVCDKFFWENSW